MADRLKLAQGLRNLPASAREDLAGREQDIQRGKTVELLRRAGKEMYDNPIVNTAIGMAPGASDIQAGYEFGRSLEEGRPWYETAAWGASALPGIPTFAGIFAGKGAKTADLAKLAKAEEMTATGLPREQIWNETGWFQGPDKQWRFEIPDYQAGFKGNVVQELREKPGVEQQKIFQHELLHEAYPQSAKIWTSKSAGEGGGGYSTGIMGESDMIGLGMKKKGMPNLEEMRGTNLHELQHAIQAAEGFARGGNPTEMSNELAGLSYKLKHLEKSPSYQSGKQKSDELWNKVFASELGDVSNEEAMRLHEQILKEYPELNEYADTYKEMQHLNAYAIPGHPTAYFDPTEAYYRLAGEEEARLAQKRMNLTPEELKANPPFIQGMYGYDAPAEKQIVRFDSPDWINQ